MSGSLEGKVAVVTGGSSGIGRATALALGREGARVVISDVNPEGGEETARAVRDSGGEAGFHRADVSGDNDVKSLVAETVASYGRLDCAFNNAGIATGAGALTHEWTEEDWERLMAVNLKGVWLCLKHQIPQMLQQGSGAIVNTSSIGGLIGLRGASAYVASKHAVVGLTRTAALEYAESGIRVNAVCPGYIYTPMLTPHMQRNPEFETQAAGLHAMKRLGTPEEVAEAVIWLCSDAASFVTGHAMTVDGGYVAQ